MATRPNVPNAYGQVSPMMPPSSGFERELLRMMQQERQQQRPRYSWRQFFPATNTAARETQKVAQNGIRMNSNGTVTINGTTYSRDEFRGALEINMRAMRADPNSAYNDLRHLDHKQAVAEMALGYKFMAGELTDSDEREIVTEWQAATQETSEVSNPQPYEQIAEMWKDPGVRAAKQRRDAGGRLDDRQKEIMRQYDQIEAANNAQAYRERASTSTPKPLNRYIGRDVMAFATNQNKVQRQQLAAEHRAKVLGDRNHPYWNASSTEHKAAVVGMTIATQMMQTGESDVQIGPDGTIEE